jgi:hypothetical protein
MGESYACVGGPLNGRVVDFSGGKFLIAAIVDRNRKGKIRRRKVTYAFAAGAVGDLSWRYLKYSGAYRGE